MVVGSGGLGTGGGAGGQVPRDGKWEPSCGFCEWGGVVDSVR